MQLVVAERKRGCFRETPDKISYGSGRGSLVWLRDDVDLSPPAAADPEADPTPPTAGW